MLVEDRSSMYPATLLCFPDSPAFPCRGISALTVQGQCRSTIPNHYPNSSLRRGTNGSNYSIDHQQRRPITTFNISTLHIGGGSAGLLPATTVHLGTHQGPMAVTGQRLPNGMVTYGTLKQQKKNGSLKEEPFLPKDPRLWGRDDVTHWLIHMTMVHRLPAIHLDRFLMNGKGLCLMTMEMFVKRVPLGGKLLYKDFRLRLSSAIYS